ncbi:MAG TPA: LiaF domain-containing protein [Gemmatimonadaceae bacterium]|nr:LiaF domain-containing protein [Gemmatimonadaceae bacterium]
MSVQRAIMAASVALLGSVGASEPMHAQEMRAVGMSRQLHDTSAVAVQVRLGAGRLELGAADGRLLYDLRARFQPAAVEALHTWDATDRRAVLGLRGLEGDNLSRVTERSPAPELAVDLGRGAAIDLDLDLGAVQADLDLGGLRLSRVHMSSGASDSHLRFSSPNPVHMSSLEVQVGAAELTMERLADANTGLVRVSSGLGSVDLDFSGTWQRDIALQLEVALGSVRIRVPRSVGVSVEHSRFLGRFDTTGLEKRGDRWVTPDFDAASYKLVIRAHTAIGKLSLDRS